MTTTDLATTNGAALIVPDDKVTLLKRTIADEAATDDELELFIAVANRTGLYPFARQIHAVWRYDDRAERKVMTIQTAIAGYRLIAQRTGEYAGQTKRQWCDKSGQWVDVWLAKDPPAAARVGVYRRGFVEPLVMTALMDAYKGPGPFWRMPKCVDQLAKCAEALALRAAFPQELSGLYTTEEMSQADSPPTSAVEAPPLPEQVPALPVSHEQVESPAGGDGVRGGPPSPPIQPGDTEKVKQALAHLPDDLRAEVAAKWKEQRIWQMSSPNFTKEEEERALALIAPYAERAHWIEECATLLEGAFGNDEAAMVAALRGALDGKPLAGTEEEYLSLTTYLKEHPNG